MSAVSPEVVTFSGVRTKGSTGWELGLLREAGFCLALKPGATCADVMKSSPHGQKSPEL
jgi:hypothetical protein